MCFDSCALFAARSFMWTTACRAETSQIISLLDISDKNDLSDFTMSFCLVISLATQMGTRKLENLSVALLFIAKIMVSVLILSIETPEREI